MSGTGAAGNVNRRALAVVTGSGSAAAAAVQQGAGLFKLRAGSRTKETVVTDLGTTARQRVQEDAADELCGGESDTAQLLAAIITIAKSDLPISKLLEPMVTESDAKDVARQILQHLRPAAGTLAMDQPITLPDSAR